MAVDLRLGLGANWLDPHDELLVISAPPAIAVAARNAGTPNLSTTSASPVSEMVNDAAGAFGSK